MNASAKARLCVGEGHPERLVHALHLIVERESRRQVELVTTAYLPDAQWSFAGVFDTLHDDLLVQSI